MKISAVLLILLTLIVLSILFVILLHNENVQEDMFRENVANTSVVLTCFEFGDGWELVSTHEDHTATEYICEKDGVYGRCIPIEIPCN